MPMCVCVRVLNTHRMLQTHTHTGHSTWNVLVNGKHFFFVLFVFFPRKIGENRITCALRLPLFYVALEFVRWMCRFAEKFISAIQVLPLFLLPECGNGDASISNQIVVNFDYWNLFILIIMCWRWAFSCDVRQTPSMFGCVCVLSVMTGYSDVGGAEHGMARWRRDKNAWEFSKCALAHLHTVHSFHFIASHLPPNIFSSFVSILLFMPCKRILSSFTKFALHLDVLAVASATPFTHAELFMCGVVWVIWELFIWNGRQNRETSTTPWTVWCQNRHWVNGLLVVSCW